MKKSFSKTHLTYREQTNLLKSRNLTISNEQFCNKKLQHINYYRLSAYFHPFYQEQNKFRDDSKFEDVIKLYYFDKEFRNLIFYSIEKIEVYIRTQLSYTISKHNGVFGYTDISIFHNQENYKEILNTIKSETGRSKEVFVKEFFDKYNEEYLPIWSMVEIISFNTLSKIYANLKETYRREIVKDIDIKPLVFESWLHTLTYIRNICAHHSRLWNKMLAIEPTKPRNQHIFHTLNNKKIFFVLTMIQFILEKIDDEELNFKNEIKKIIFKYPNTNINTMGFFENWELLELWKD